MNDGLLFTTETRNGMSLRAYFAGRALQGMLSDNENHQDMNWVSMAEQAVRAADALIRALEEDPK